VTVTGDMLFFFFSLIRLHQKQHNLSRDRSELSPRAASNRPVREVFLVFPSRFQKCLPCFVAREAGKSADP
jgi:hypothetical protein